MFIAVILGLTYWRRSAQDRSPSLAFLAVTGVFLFCLGVLVVVHSVRLWRAAQAWDAAHDANDSAGSAEAALARLRRGMFFTLGAFCGLFCLGMIVMIGLGALEVDLYYYAVLFCAAAILLFVLGRRMSIAPCAGPASAWEPPSDATSPAERGRPEDEWR